VLMADGLASDTMPLFVTTHLLLAGLLSLALAVFELRSYQRIVTLRQMHLSRFDSALVFSSIWLKSLLLLVAALLLAAPVLALSHRAGRATLAVAWSLLVGWLVVDVRLHRITGNHLLKYAVYAFNTQAWGWGGDVAALVKKMRGYLAPAVGIGLLSLWATSALSPWLGNRLAWLSHPAALPAGAAGYPAGLRLLLAARRRVHHPLALERLHRAFPCSLGLFTRDAVPGVTRIAFGVDCDASFEEVLRPIYPATQRPAPLDLRPLLTRANPPGVLILIAESFRAEAMQPDAMPHLHAWSQAGMRLTRHYANSNNSYMGDFALLYGRSPLVYDAHIGSSHLPQFCATLKRAGYQTALFGSAGFNNHHMYRFMGKGGFDHVDIATEGTWPQRDLKGLNAAADLLRRSHDDGKPRLVVATLYATHYGYYYPPQYGRLHTAMTDQRGVRREHLTAQDVHNRYRNCLAFVDDAIQQLLSKIDLDRHLVVVTGDHGESFGEDGFRFHSSRLSDVQTNVPMVIRGPGIPARHLTRLTGHQDILPTLLHALLGQPATPLGCHGRDLLAPDIGDDQVLLVQPQIGAWELLLLRPDGRLALTLDHDRCRVRVLGFGDEHGRIDTRLSRKAEDIDTWRAALAAAVAPLAGQPTATA